MLPVRFLLALALAMPGLPPVDVVEPPTLDGNCFYVSPCDAHATPPPSPNVPHGLLEGETLLDARLHDGIPILLVRAGEELRVVRCNVGNCSDRRVDVVQRTGNSDDHYSLALSRSGSGVVVVRTVWNGPQIELFFCNPECSVPVSVDVHRAGGGSVFVYRSTQGTLRIYVVTPEGLAVVGCAEPTCATPTAPRLLLRHPNLTIVDAVLGSDGKVRLLMLREGGALLASCGSRACDVLHVFVSPRGHYDSGSLDMDPLDRPVVALATHGTWYGEPPKLLFTICHDFTCARMETVDAAFEGEASDPRVLMDPKGRPAILVAVRAPGEFGRTLRILNCLNDHCSVSMRFIAGTLADHAAGDPLWAGFDKDKLPVVFYNVNRLAPGTSTVTMLAVTDPEGTFGDWQPRPEA